MTTVFLISSQLQIYNHKQKENTRNRSYIITFSVNAKALYWLSIEYQYLWLHSFSLSLPQLLPPFVRVLQKLQGG